MTTTIANSNAETKAEIRAVAAYNIDVKVHGAIGDGNTDDTAAIQAALSEALSIDGSSLFFPAGDYLLSSGAVSGIVRSWTQLSIYGEGKDVSRIIVDNTAGGILLECATRRSPVTISNFSILTKKFNGGIGFKYEVTSPGGAQRRNIFEAHNVNIGAYNDDGIVNYAFNQYMIAKGMYRPFIENCTFNSSKASTHQAVSVIDIDDTYSAYILSCELIVTTNSGTGAIVGISDVGLIVAGEGGWCVNTIINGAKTGYKRVRNGREPVFYFQNNHINSDEVGLHLDGGKYCYLQNNIMYHNQSYAGVTGYKDFYILNADQVHEENNIYQEPSLPGSAHRYHVYFDDTYSVAGANAVIRNVNCTKPGLQCTYGLDTYYINEVTATTNITIEMSRTLPIEGAAYTGSATYPEGLCILEGTNAHLIKTDIDSIDNTPNDNVSFPKHYIYRNGGVGVNGNALGSILFEGNNDLGNKTQYATIRAAISDASDATEDGYFQIYTALNGGQNKQFQLGGNAGGLALGNWLPQGSGTLVVADPAGSGGIYCRGADNTPDRVVGEQQTPIDDYVITWGAGEPSPGHSHGIGDGGNPSSSELGQAVADLTAIVNELLAKLRTHGLIDTT